MKSIIPKGANPDPVQGPGFWTRRLRQWQADRLQIHTVIHYRLVLYFDLVVLQISSQQIKMIIPGVARLFSKDHRPYSEPLFEFLAFSRSMARFLKKTEGGQSGDRVGIKSRH